jgi:hypothetical protein
MSTPFQDEARRKNAQKSTGPRTEAGKARSRANSTVHGLAGKGAVHTGDLAEYLEEQRFKLGAKVDHADDHTVRLETELLLAAARTDLCRAARSKLVAERWEHERRLAALELAERLPRSPQRIALELERTTQGVDWKLERWRTLSYALEHNGTWTEAELAHAFDLLGAPHLDRDAQYDPAEIEISRTIIREEVERLETWRDEVLVPGEEMDRLASELGVPVNETRTFRLLRRYEREHANKYMRIAEKLGLQVRPGQALAAPRPVPEVEAPTEEVEEAPAPVPQVQASQEVTQECVQECEQSIKAKQPAPVPFSPPPVGFRDEPGDPSCGLEGSYGPPVVSVVSGWSPRGPPLIH